jgi:hypothetical protein
MLRVQDRRNRAVASSELEAAAADARHFTPAAHGAGRRLDRGNPLLAGLREACGQIHDALPAVRIIRYRALIINSPSLAIARSLGFAG